MVGAARLQQHRDAVVADMGGTTLDVALLRNGAPVLSEAGACIGGFRTSVRAMAAETVGLGGDSEIDLSEWPRVHIGPRRILPFCRIGELDAGVAERLPALLSEAASRSRHCTDMLALAPGATVGENRLLQQLTGGPMPLGILARRLNRALPDHLPWHDLESHGTIMRCGLTLTDILHLQGRFTRFDVRPVHDLLRCWGALLDAEPGDLVEAILQEFRRQVCDTVLRLTLPADAPWHDTGSFRHWLTNHLAANDSPQAGVRFKLQLHDPLVAVGAPVSALFPSLATCLGQDIIISDHAGVANAVGAVAGDVMLRQTASIRARDDGALVCSWRGGNHRAANLEQALQTCEEKLTELLVAAAKENELTPTPPHFSVTTHQADTRDGVVFLGLTMSGEIRG